MTKDKGGVQQAQKNGWIWTDELAICFAEMHRFSSGRTSVKQFKEMIGTDWHKALQKTAKELLNEWEQQQDEKKVSEQLAGYIHEIDSLREVNRKLGEKYATPDGWMEREATVIPRCKQCGGKQVLIRGRYPKTEGRVICPTCTYERIEQIQEISKPDYGKTYK